MRVGMLAAGHGEGGDCDSQGAQWLQPAGDQEGHERQAPVPARWLGEGAQPAAQEALGEQEAGQGAGSTPCMLSYAPTLLRCSSLAWPELARPLTTTPVP